MDWKLALVIVGGTFAGVTAGTQLLEHLKRLPEFVLRGNPTSVVEFVVPCLFFVMLSYITIYISRDVMRRKDRDHDGRYEGLFHLVKLPFVTRFETLDTPELSLVPVCYFGVFVGLANGLLGIGGGVVLLPALIYLVGQRPVKAAGTSLAVILLTSIYAASTHMSHGNVDIALFAALAGGGILGTQIGTPIGLKIGGNRIRKYFIFVVLAAVALVVARILSLLGIV